MFILKIQRVVQLYQIHCGVFILKVNCSPPLCNFTSLTGSSDNIVRHSPLVKKISIIIKNGNFICFIYSAYLPQVVVCVDNHGRGEHSVTTRYLSVEGKDD